MNKYKNLPKEVYIICIGVLLSNLGSYVYPLLTFIGKDYNMNLKEIAMISSAMMITSILGMTLGGKLADTLGRKRTFTTFMFISGFLFLMMPLFTSKLGFIAIVLLSSFASSIGRPASRTMITDLTSQDQRKEAFGLQYIAMNVGFSFGPALGAFIYNININYLFIGDGFTTMLFAIFIMLFIAETKPTDKEIDDHDVKGEEKQEGSALDVMRKKPELIYLLLFNCLIIFTFKQFTFGIPLYTESVLGSGNGAIVYGICMTINGVVVSFMTPVTAKICEGIKPSLGMAIGGVLMATGFGLYGFVRTPVMMYMATFIWSIAETFWVMNSISYETNHTPISHRGRLSALMQNTQTLFKMTTVMTAGFIFNKVNINQFWIIIASFSLMASVIALKLYRYEEESKIVIDEKK